MIHPLSQDVIAKIAAGEVIDRPGSVVKELVENSLDAGAQNIIIELEESGMKLISVKDDGSGMNPTDLGLCYLPHTTSKIFSFEDLARVMSFGFRGEALSSIAAVSHLIIQSRQQHQEAGTALEIENGQCIKTIPVGMPFGTQIFVESLFSHIPARKKFLKNNHNELSFIIKMLTQVSLAHPTVSFKLNHNDKPLLYIPADRDLTTRIKSVLGEELFNNCVPVEYTTHYGTIKGYIGKPEIAEQHHNNQYLFVNNRNVNGSLLSKVITQSYGSLIEPRAYPTFILFFTLPHDHIDVNIHPRKEEVAFAFQGEVENLVHEAIEKSLETHDLTYGATSLQDLLNERKMDRHTAQVLRKTISPWNLKPDAEPIILHVKNLYLVMPIEDGMLVVDQHAAHERILFEQFKEAFLEARQTTPSYVLEKPSVFDMPVHDAHALSENIETFTTLGFVLESFGTHTFKLSAVPDIFKNRDHRMLITELLHELKERKPLKEIDRETERTLAFLACRTAIKGGDALSLEERRKLIEKIIDSPTVYTCPHGRPTHIVLSARELDKMFRRI